jgi:hypothetical protein
MAFSDTEIYKRLVDDGERFPIVSTLWAMLIYFIIIGTGLFFGVRNHYVWIGFFLIALFYEIHYHTFFRTYTPLDALSDITLAGLKK